MSSGTSPKLETATLAGGCFWCLEAVYDQLKGVESVVSGYSGGHVPNPTYKAVCSETTGHAEVVQVKYDPNVLSFGDLLQVFFTIHDPTTLNRQGNDVGTQYRSAIFYHNDEQKKIAEQVIKELDDANLWAGRIVTEITPFKEFYPAEDYHQEYFAQHGNEPYCRFVIEPKVTKFRQHYMEKLKR